MKDVDAWIAERLQSDAPFRSTIRERAWRELLLAEAAEPRMDFATREDGHGAWGRFWLAVEQYRDACIAYGEHDEHRTNPQAMARVLQAARTSRTQLDIAVRRLLVLFATDVRAQEGDIQELCQALAVTTAQTGHATAT
jgi:hypothetical protein